MLVVMNRCRNRDAEERLPLRQIFDDVCCTVDAAIMCTRRAVDLRRLEMCRSIYCGSVNSEHWRRSIFASDGQLELLRLCCLV